MQNTRAVWRLNLAHAQAGLAAMVVAAAIGLATLAPEAAAQSSVVAGTPIVARHLETPRAEATQRPRGEGDQAVVDGWPLYRTERGQTAFNEAMATLRATDGPAPSREAFRGCVRLECPLTLPSVPASGWLPAGRYWISPTEYVLLVHSPRYRNGKSYRRHGPRSMKYFVFHEFHNSSRNIDPYDTISSHSSHVFVPLYMSKSRVDAKGRTFVTVIQVAPYDVVSTHATNLDSAGPGLEVAKNAADDLEPLQALAGILVASLATSASPALEVVNHHGQEGLEMLQAYDGRLERLRRRAGAASLTLPFAAAQEHAVAAVSARLEDLIARPGLSPQVPVAARGIAPTVRSASAAQPAPVLLAPPQPARRPTTFADGRGG